MSDHICQGRRRRIKQSAQSVMYFGVAIEYMDSASASDSLGRRGKKENRRQTKTSGKRAKRAWHSSADQVTVTRKSLSTEGIHSSF